MRIACLLSLLATAIAVAQERSFIACPIVRDTKTVPCFLAEYEGELYYLGIQQDITAAFHPPQLKHEVLVEGRAWPVRGAAASQSNPHPRSGPRSGRARDR